LTIVCRRVTVGAERSVHFIEDLFGISPDGGSGATELAFVAAFAMIVVLVVWRRRAMRRLRRRRDR